MTPKHLLSLVGTTPTELNAYLDLADEFRRTRGQAACPRPLAGQSLAMLFTKSSTRTRVSFQVGIFELGGHAMYLDGKALQVGRGESLADTAMVMNRYVHGLVIRCNKQTELEEYAQYSSVPVINALTDMYHPCQLVADLQTIRALRGGDLAGTKVTFMGDGACNMARSWAVAAKLAGLDLTIGAPERYWLDQAFLDSLAGAGSVRQVGDPAEAMRGADIVYTDVWISMGFEEESAQRLADLPPFQVTPDLMQLAAPDARFMHCLPAYRGKEVAAEVIDGPRSIVWDQAENRLHAQKAIMAKLLA